MAASMEVTSSATTSVTGSAPPTPGNCEAKISSAWPAGPCPRCTSSTALPSSGIGMSSSHRERERMICPPRLITK